MLFRNVTHKDPQSFQLSPYKCTQFLVFTLILLNFLLLSYFDLEKTFEVTETI